MEWQDWSHLGSGVNSYVNALAVSGTNLFAGGAFTTAGGVTANYIAAWNGRTWSALGSNNTQNVNYTITLSASPTNGGTVGGGGIFASNSTVTVTATNNSGYVFTGWTSNGIPVISSTNYTFTLNTNVTLVANFVPGYTVTVSASPVNSGKVSSGGTYASNSIITVTATNNSGYVFAGWTSNGIAAVSTTNYNFTLSTNVTLIADFLPLYTVTVSASPSAGGTVSPSGTNVSGSTITVIATNNNGYAFANWTENGSVVSSSNSYTFTLTNNLNLVADFVIRGAVSGKPKLTISSPKSGQRWSNAVFTVTGTVTDKVAVDDVYYQLNGGSWTAARPPTAGPIGRPT